MLVGCHMIKDWHYYGGISVFWNLNWLHAILLSIGKNIDDKIVVDDTCNIGTYLYKHVFMM